MIVESQFSGKKDKVSTFTSCQVSLSILASFTTRMRALLESSIILHLTIQFCMHRLLDLAIKWKAFLWTTYRFWLILQDFDSRELLCHLGMTYFSKDEIRISFLYSRVSSETTQALWTKGTNCTSCLAKLFENWKIARSKRNDQREFRKCSRT